MIPILAAAASENELPPILQASPGLMIWTLITFAIAMVLMYKLAFGRIQEALDNRRRTIAESVEQAERTRAEAAELLEQYRQQLDTARTEAASIVDRARKAGDDLAAKVREATEEQRRDAIAQTQAQVQLEVEKAMGDLRSTVAEMTVTAAEKVLKGSIDLTQHQRLIEQAVEELDFDRLQKVGSRS